MFAFGNAMPEGCGLAGRGFWVGEVNTAGGGGVGEGGGGAGGAGVPDWAFSWIRLAAARIAGIWA